MIDLMEHGSIFAADRLSSNEVSITPTRMKRIFMICLLSIMALTLFFFYEEGVATMQENRDVAKMVSLLQKKEDSSVNLVRSNIDSNGFKRKKRDIIRDDDMRKYNVLTLGGSVTWGEKLESKEKTAYPNILHAMGKHRVTNISIRASSPFYPSLCIQSILEQHSDEDSFDFDVILLEFSLANLRGIDTLVKRLQYRFPNAVFVYVHLYTLRAVTLVYGGSGELQWNPLEKHRTQPGPAIRGLFEQIEGYMYVLPTSAATSSFSDTNVPNNNINDNPYWARSLFQHDMIHLSLRGHQLVAEEISSILDNVHFGVPIPHIHSDFDGLWGYGDRCVSWFRSGDILGSSSPRIIQHYTGSHMVQTGHQGGSALEFTLTDVGTVTIHNAHAVDVPLFFTYLLTPNTNPLRVRITLSDSVSIELIPDASESYMVETVEVGIIPPGDNILTIAPTASAESAPFLLIAVELFGFRHHQGLPIKKMHNRISYNDALDIIVR